MKPKLRKPLAIVIVLSLYFFMLCGNAFAQNTFPSTGSTGIGTNAPNASSLLEIKSTTKGLLIPRMTVAQRNAIPSPATGLLIYQTNSATPGFYYYSGTAWKAVSAGTGWSITGNAGTNSSTNFIGTTDAQPLVFKTNNVQRAIINTSGNFGVGIAAPGNKMEVAAAFDGDGIAVVGSGSGPKDAAFILKDDLGHNASLGLASFNNAFMSGVESGDIILTNPAGKVHLGTGSPTGFPAMTVSGGNVGIGALNPGYLLDVAGRMRIRSGGSSSGTWLMNVANTVDAAFIGMQSDNAVGIYGAGGLGFGFVMNINNGNVGIGNTAPGAKLHLNVNGFDAYQGLAITNVNSGGKTLTINQGTLGKLNFTQPGIVDLMTMDFTTQRIGIGTTSPGYKLDVCGTIRAKEIRVESGWCDYVFEKNYKLRSIDELEQFVSKNKHLPGIVPAAEVEKEGLKVAEMSKAMMEKIEELTLYVIQLSGENKKLQAEIDLLKK